MVSGEEKGQLYRADGLERSANPPAPVSLLSYFQENAITYNRLEYGIGNNSDDNVMKMLNDIVVNSGPRVYRCRKIVLAAASYEAGACSLISTTVSSPTWSVASQVIAIAAFTL